MLAIYVSISCNMHMCCEELAIVEVSREILVLEPIILLSQIIVLSSCIYMELAYVVTNYLRVK